VLSGPKSFRRIGADPHDVVIPGAFRESFYKDTVIKSSFMHSTENRDLFEESNKNLYKNAASRYVENIWFPVSGRCTVVLLG